MRSNTINSNKAACYLRLSREDGDKAESDSISNQRNLINDYVNQRNGIMLIKEYVDDGYSGTNFERPSFKRMMEDVKIGKINCIIVKDLSRLGRNYIETGRYLERIFPFIGVRFISILDHYDSADESNDSDQIIIPFKNLINDSYCRDISTKIRSQLDVKRRTGKFIGSFACYGYCKDPKDNNHLLVDPVAADNVREIFRMKLEGYNSQRIADALNEVGALPPAEYKRSNGLNYDSGFRMASGAGWSPTSVNRILANEVYTGTMVQGLNRKISYKIKQTRAVPKEDWIRVEDTHEAIISKDMFEEVQRLMLFDTRTSPEEDGVYLFSGLVICGDCLQNMVRRRVSKGDKKYSYFHCSTYKSGKGCSSHLFSAKQLEEIVTDTIRKQIALFLRAQSIIEAIDRIPQEQSRVKRIVQQMDELQKEINRYRGFKTKAYEDMLEGIIDKDEFVFMKRTFTDKINAAEARYQHLQIEKASAVSDKKYLKPWIENLKKYQNIEKLERPIVVALIEQIIIYDKENIVIKMHFEDEMQDVIRLARETSEEFKREEAEQCV